MAINGLKIIVTTEEHGAIAGVKSDDIQTSAETIERSSPFTGAWRTHVTKRKGWSFSTNYLVMSTSALGISSVTGLQDILQVGNEYKLYIKDRRYGEDDGVNGTAILTKCKISAKIGNLVQGNFEFLGNSELEATPHVEPE